jgi:Fe-S cluster biogenesis protein NfuA
VGAHLADSTLVGLLETVSVCSPNMADLAGRVAAKITEMERYLARTGGHVELVDVEDAIARIRVFVTRPRTGRLVATLQLKSGIERALLGDIPELRGVEAINLPPYTVLGWDQPGFTPVELPRKDGS